MEFLDASHNALEVLCEDLKEMIALTHLNVAYNRLSLLPLGLGNCRMLRLLDASRNRLNTLPESFRDLVSLEYCNLEHNLIRVSDEPSLSLNQQIQNGKKVVSVLSLQVEKDQRVSLLDGLIALKVLNLGFNRMQTLGLGSMAGRVGGGGLFSMTSLDLSNNNLLSLPGEIGLLQQMLSLTLKGNDLTYLPPEIGSLSSLTTLNLSCNKLKLLPDMIGQVRSIQELDLSDNSDLACLPRTVIGLVQVH